MRNPEKGLSLIEIMIALAITALVISGAVVGYRSVKRSQLTSSVNQLAGIIRYARDKAVTSNQFYRLRFDFKEQSYELEKTEDRVLLKQGTSQRDESKLEDSNSDEDLLDDLLPKGAEFEKGADSIAKKIQLSKSIVLRFVKVARFDNPTSSGIAYLHFFPDGHVEPAWLCMARKDDPDFPFSLEVKSLNGRVITKSGCPSLSEMK